VDVLKEEGALLLVEKAVPMISVMNVVNEVILQEIADTGEEEAHIEVHGEATALVVDEVDLVLDLQEKRDHDQDLEAEVVQDLPKKPIDEVDLVQDHRRSLVEVEARAAANPLQVKRREVEAGNTLIASFVSPLVFPYYIL